MKIIAALVVLISCACIVRAQETTAPENANALRVPLTEQPSALDAAGSRALGARLVTPPTELVGTPAAPVRNVRFQMQNLSRLTYLYASGWVVFFDAVGARCGAGQWTTNVLAPNETVELDAPGLRLTCAPAAWRIEATNLILPGPAIGGALPPAVINGATASSSGDTSSADVSTLRENSIVILIPREGEIYLRGQRIAVAGLALQLAELMATRSEPERVVYINADSNVQYDAVIEILDIIRRNGNYPVALVGRKGNTVESPNPTP